jgi:hypothetical protein
MSARLQDHQLDLRLLAAVLGGHEKLPPEVRVTVLVLLKRLLTETVFGPAKTRPVDE